MNIRITKEYLKESSQILKYLNHLFFQLPPPIP